MFPSKFFVYAFAFNIVTSGIGQASSHVGDEDDTAEEIESVIIRNVGQPSSHVSDEDDPTEETGSVIIVGQPSILVSDEDDTTEELDFLESDEDDPTEETRSVWNPGLSSLEEQEKMESVCDEDEDLDFLNPNMLDEDDKDDALDEILRSVEGKGKGKVHMRPRSVAQVRTIGVAYTYRLPEPPEFPDLPDRDSPSYKLLAAQCKELVAKYKESTANLYDPRIIRLGVVARNTDAYFAKGLLLEYGAWPKVEPFTAVDWYKKAAKKGSVWALKRLYFIFKNGELGRRANKIIADRCKGNYLMITQKSIPDTDFEPLCPEILLGLQKELQKKSSKKLKLGHLLRDFFHHVR